MQELGTRFPLGGFYTLAYSKICSVPASVAQLWLKHVTPGIDEVLQDQAVMVGSDLVCDCALANDADGMWLISTARVRPTAPTELTVGQTIPYPTHEGWDILTALPEEVVEAWLNVLPDDRRAIVLQVSDTSAAALYNGGAGYWLIQKTWNQHAK
jgi:hypothetical protein